jgi:large subunit ribosomal protein L2
MFDLKTKPLTFKFLIQRAQNLRLGWNASGGRNSAGIITSYKKGPHKYRRVYRFIDFWRRLRVDAFVVRFDKDSFRSSTLTLLFYQTGFVSYAILPDGYSVGDKLPFSFRFDSHGEAALFPGNALPLADINEGAFVFNIELWPTKGAQICRSAGSYAIIVAKRLGFVTLKLRSGWKMVVSNSCCATIGSAPNDSHSYRVLRKAGLRVNLGRRPTVRGVAMNPIDHPHGGGRGKTSGGPKPRTPWGRITKQQKTVLKKFRVAAKLVRFR